RHDRGQELVRVQAALHQELGLALAHELDRLGRGGVAVRRVDDPRLSQVEARLLRDLLDRRFRTDEDRLAQAVLAGLDRAPERALLAREGDRGRDRLEALAARE